MAQWFHRNPLKSTAVVNFELPATNGNSQSLIRTRSEHPQSDKHLLINDKDSRYKLLQLISEPKSSFLAVESAFKVYASLVYGLCISIDPNHSGDSKLRHIVNFRWTDTLSGSKTIDKSDAIFEHCNMMFNVALWYTKLSSRLAAQNDPDMEIAKDVYKYLKVAAGIFTFIKDDLIAHLNETDRTLDFDSRVLSAYTEQTLAEAQEGFLKEITATKHPKPM